MVKKKDRNAKRQQKKGLKKARRKETLRKARSRRPPPRKKSGEGVTEAMFPMKEHMFWMAHGINFLNSDYGEGLWSPLFPEIYEDEPLVPEPETIIQRVKAHFNVDDVDGDWPMKAQTVVAWTAQDREIFWIYKKEALRRVREAYPKGTDVGAVARKAHNATVWGMFHEMIEKKAVGRAVARKQADFAAGV